MFGFLYAPSTGCSQYARSFYQSLFCGLACQLHEDYHISARFLVNRDSTFLSLIGASLQSDSPQVVQRTCCNPLATPRAITVDAPTQGYSAAVTVAALATKLDDNVDDERGLRRHLPRVAAKLMEPARDKAILVLNSSHFPTQSVIHDLEGQSQLESSLPSFADACAPTANAYGHIFSHLAKIHSTPAMQRPLFSLGSSLGRLIYWKDAIDDWQSDLKRGRFNPLIHHPANDLPPLVQHEFSNLENIASDVHWPRHGDIIQSVIGHTLSHHQSMTETPSPGSYKKRLSKKQRKRKKDSGCCDFLHCGPCDCSDCCTDSCCSSGDATSGCCNIDCNCCDCCSCN